MARSGRRSRCSSPRSRSARPCCGSCRDRRGDASPGAHRWRCRARARARVVAFLVVGVPRAGAQALATFVAAEPAAGRRARPRPAPAARCARACVVARGRARSSSRSRDRMWGFRWEEVRREGIDLVVAIDTSRSMLATDVKPNRLARAKLAVRDLLPQLQGDRVGLVAFAGTRVRAVPADARLRRLRARASTRSTSASSRTAAPRSPPRSTPRSRRSRARQGKHQALVLITDGEDHEGDGRRRRSSARPSAASKIFTVGIGTTEGELIPREARRLPEGPQAARS